ncbi:MAG: hypothetical protein MI920_37970 [Kiloniellales bacterium]|nr:hypothetical protein [Kiloniellales bacterium]
MPGKRNEQPSFPPHLALILAASLALGACAPQRALEAKRLLEDVAAVEGPSSLKEATEPPARREIAFVQDGRDYLADLYEPADGTVAGLVLVPGLTPAGRNDRRFVPFAKSLARSGFRVLVPEIASLRELRVSAANAEPIAAAVHHLSGLDRPEAPRPVGLIAISYAAGPAVIAALEPELRDKVAFLGLIGGYYDIEAVVTYFTTGYFRLGPGEPWRQGSPNAYGKWVFVQSNAPYLEDPHDRVTLISMAMRKRRNLEADIADLVAALGDEGRRVHDLLENRDPERVAALIAALPVSLRNELTALDLKRRDLDGLGARLLLVHGRDDPVIPSIESEKLAAALPEGQSRLYLADNLIHAELRPGGLADAFTLWEAAYRLLEERDRLATKR